MPKASAKAPGPSNAKTRPSTRTKKKGKTTATAETEDERPTKDEYENLEVFRSFVITGEDDEEFKFLREQVVLILGSEDSPDESHDLPSYWVAKIKDIRAKEFEDGSNRVWVQVQWFYSGKDVSDMVRAFDSKAIGTFERLFSDHLDIVEPFAFEMVIPMFKFCDVDHEQSFIPRDAFYRRYTFDHLKKKVQPNPKLMACKCRKPYDPDDMDPQSLMHFCPRPSCRKAYHNRCLIGIKSKESSTTHKASVVSVKIPRVYVSQTLQDSPVKSARSARKHAAPSRKRKAVSEDEDEDGSNTHDGLSFPLSPRALRLLSCSPDTDDTLDLHSLIPVSNMDVNSVLQKIPLDLLTIATQPLVRGGAFVSGGVAGNIGMVTKARRLVYAALQVGEDQDGISDWQETVFGADRDVQDVGIKNAVVEVKFNSGQKRAGNGLPPFICPNCKSAI